MRARRGISHLVVPLAMTARRGISHLAVPLTMTASVTAGVVLLAGGSGAQPQTPTPLPSPLPSATGELGRTLYLRDCAWCHGADLQGTDFGPSLIGVGAASVDFMLSTGRMPIDRASGQPVRRPSAYPEGERNGIVQYVAGIGDGPSIPEARPDRGALPEGNDLYEIHCAACHSSTGIGGALTSGLVAPDLLHSTPVEVAEAVRLGGAGLRSGNMPRFSADVISDRELDSLVAYVRYLQHPVDKGGQNLGHIGPVVEGLVAWVGALLLLVFFIRWIGEKAPR